MKKFIITLFASMACFLENFFLMPTMPDSPVTQNMAKVKFSALVSEMRGKLNGSVFSRNRGGAYLRTKVTPLNPQTSAQVLARNLVSLFAQAWRSLTEAQRGAWNNAVSNFQSTDIFGDVVNPTGSTLYTKLNINISNAGGTPITSPPNPVGADALTDLSLTAAVTGDTFDVVFAPGTVPADHSMYVEATAPLSAGVYNANSEFRFIAIVAAAGTTPADLFTAYTTKFGALSAGQKIFVRAKFIRTDTGEVSQKLVASAIIGA